MTNSHKTKPNEMCSTVVFHMVRLLVTFIQNHCELFMVLCSEMFGAVHSISQWKNPVQEDLKDRDKSGSLTKPNLDWLLFVATSKSGEDSRQTKAYFEEQ